ncbi:MAG: hypothetical protein O3A64_01520 [Proteobacteria bacterium]|nr:hypothetical protein [Pseudomonadota bacterium]
MISFQAESKKSGDEFEDLVLSDLKERGFGVIKKNVYVEQSGCEVDFVAYGIDWVIEYVEAKGGRDDAGKRPGAQRTDNVKKAVANGALIKAIDPSIYFVVYFSAKPTTGSSSDKMLKTALCHKIIDEVRYIANKELIDTQLYLFNAESEAEK